MVERRYCSVFYVTPPRKTFAMREFGFSEHILKPLWMGADFETLPYEQKTALRGAIRERYGIPGDASIMVLAGKLDTKKRPVKLAEAFYRLDNAKWWLLYVGSMDDDIHARVEQAAGHTGRIVFTGFLSGGEVLEHIAASDLAVYPGAHSVLWEQTVCLGIPAVFYEELPGDAAHLSDGNALFLHRGDADEILDCLQRICADETALIQMGYRARRYAEDNLSYDKTAEKALRDCGFPIDGSSFFEHI
jgi:glycosyltransferase involved in cell wall biosynthesis